MPYDESKIGATRCRADAAGEECSHGNLCFFAHGQETQEQAVARQKEAYMLKKKGKNLAAEAVGGGGGGGEPPMTPKKEKVPFVVPGAPVKASKVDLLEKGLKLATAQEKTIAQQNAVIAYLMELLDERNMEIEELKQDLIGAEMQNKCLEEEADAAEAAGGGGGA